MLRTYTSRVASAFGACFFGSFIAFDFTWVCISYLHLVSFSF